MTRFDSYIITKVTEGEDKPVNDSAISVYIPKPNDSLWEISKELGVTEEEILKINKDLTFPLSGEERIVVYREVDIKE
jgi:LysM repeat protein